MFVSASIFKWKDKLYLKTNDNPEQHFQVVLPAKSLNPGY
jgi:hypothetical protein